MKKIIIDFDGSSAVGKTSCIKLISNELGGKVIHEVLENDTPPIKTPTNQLEFLEKQIWFIDRGIKRYIKAQQNVENLNYIDLGMIDILFHSKYYPIVNGFEWDIMGSIKDHLNKNYSNLNFSNYVIFLDASVQNLITRKQKDKINSRSHHQENMKLHCYKRKFYRLLSEHFPKTIKVISTDNLNSILVSKNIIKIILELETSNSNSPNLMDIVNLLEGKENFNVGD